VPVTEPAESSGPTDRAAVPWFLLAAVLLVALTLRGPIIAVAPVVDDIRSGLHIGAGTAGLLTSIPVLCFGLGTPLVLAIVNRAGIERAVLIGLAGTLLGVVIRSAGGLSSAIIGTVVIGLSITIGNVVIPVVIGRDFPGRAAAVAGAYTGALNVGSMITSTLTAPLADLIGWRAAIASWAVLVVIAAAAWRPATARVPPVPSTVLLKTDESGEAVPLWRRPLVIGLTLSFGGQAFSYYGVTAWLPSLLSDRIGLSRGEAGASSSIFQIVALVGAFAVPVMVARQVPSRIILLSVCAAWMCLPVGLILAPAAWPVWCAFGGAAQGGGFTTIFSVVVARAADSRDARHISASVQGGGYIIGACGPLVVGSVHSSTGGWTAPMLSVAAAVAVMATAGTVAIGRRASGSGL
jgi:MFS transporter, CP family, cyanate transporter